jgi:hypothetical protein
MHELEDDEDTEDAEDVAALDDAMAEEHENVPWDQVRTDLGAVE